MDTEDFVNKLKIIPSLKRELQLKAMGLSQIFINEYYSSYIFNKNGDFYVKDPIQRLVRNFDGNQIKIGMITFDIEPYENSSYFFFGKYEMDLLSINKETNEILVIDFENENHIIFKCAIDSYSFLDAILHAAIFLENLPFEDIDQKIVCNTAESCSKLAGDKKYLGFYKTLLGCDQ